MDFPINKQADTSDSNDARCAGISLNPSDDHISKWCIQFELMALRLDIAVDMTPKKRYDTQPDPPHNLVLVEMDQHVSSAAMVGISSSSQARVTQVQRQTLKNH
jgi:hypothetical protein